MDEQSNGKQELVIIPNQTLSDMTDDIIASAERRTANMEKVISLSLKITNHQDWVDQNGKPYLTASGGEKIARLFGISWKILKSEKIISSDEKGQFYFYQVTGVFSLLKDSIEAVGTCSSKDQFFAKVKGELKAISEIDETNIMKAAYSNCVVNGITRLLGIRNLTWEQVEKGGVRKDAVASVRYGGDKSAEQTESDLQIQDKLQALMMELCDNDLKQCAEKLEMLSSFTGKDDKPVKGKRIVGYLSGKWLLSTYGKAKAEYQKRFGKEFVSAKPTPAESVSK